MHRILAGLEFDGEHATESGDGARAKGTPGRNRSQTNTVTALGGRPLRP